MADSPQFRRWLQIELGRVAVAESTMVIPPEEIKIEVRKNGHWTTVREDQLGS
jgi:hypothetical protein